jgi:hypothetical protein
MFQSLDAHSSELEPSLTEPISPTISRHRATFGSVPYVTFLASAGLRRARSEGSRA